MCEIPNKYSVEQRVYIYDNFVKTNSPGRVRRRFARKYPGIPIPHRTTIHKIVKKVRETGSVTDKKRQRRRSVLTQEKIDEIRASFERSPSKSLNRVAQETGVSVSSVHTAMKLLHFKPYKTPSVQQLRPEDPDQQHMFCERNLQRVHDGEIDPQISCGGAKNACDMKEDNFRTSCKQDDIKVKEEPDSDSEAYQMSSLPDGELCEVKMEEEPDPFTFVSVEKAPEELDVDVMKDELKCEVTTEEHEEGSDRLLNSTLQVTDKCKKRKAFVCEVCGVYCKKNHLVAHAQAPTEDKPFKCDVCDSRFVHKNSLKQHGKIHTGRKPHTCEECGKTFIKKSSLTVHKINHTGQKPHVCDICSKRFSSKYELKIHLRIHTGERPYSCDKCDKQYYQSGQLTIHMRTHTGEKPFLCDICNVSFAQKKNLVTHYKLKHAAVKPHKCEICSMSFAIKYQLEMHRRIHTGEKPHVCNICNKRFTQRCALSEHLHMHSPGKRFACAECDKSFPRKRYLEQHMNTHTGQKPFQCDQCDRSYAYQTALIEHKRNHTGRMPYSCDVCSKKFTRKNRLTVHLRTHNRDKSL